MGFGQGLFEIAMAALGISVITLLITKAPQTAQVTQAGTRGFVDILDTLTGQPMRGGFGGMGGY